MDELDSRVRAICDLNVAEAREYGGRHEYDGVPQDLSPAGVAAGLSRLAAARQSGPAREDPHDEAHLRAFEDLQRVVYARLELHRSNPMAHLGELDLACYDKDYAPAAERYAARAAHLAAWPTVIDAAIASLDAIPAPIADSLLGAVRGLAAAASRPTPTRARGRRRWPRTRGWSPTCSGPPIPGRPTPPSGRARSRRCCRRPRRPRSTWALSPCGPTPSATG